MITNKLPTIVWFSAITCNGNTHSLLSANSSRFELLLNNFDFIYHPSLTIDKSLEDILAQEEKIDFLLVEGAISPNKNFSNIISKIADHFYSKDTTISEDKKVSEICRDNPYLILKYLNKNY